MYDSELDKQLRRVANEAISEYEAKNDDAARRAIIRTIDMLSGFEEHLFHSEEIILPLMQIMRSLGDQDNCNRLDELLSAMMGEGRIQRNQASTDKLSATMQQIKARLQSGVSATEISWLQKTIVELIAHHAWHFDEYQMVCELVHIAQKHGLDGQIHGLQSLRGNLRAQQIKGDIYGSEANKLYLDWIDYPAIITIETFMKCNARCSFCPYPMMEEQGIRADQKLSKQLFEKIINDLKDIPPESSFTINLSRVNEPLLDTRIYGFMKIIDDQLQNCDIWLPSNGSTLTEKNIRKLNDINCFTTLGISINSNNPEDYERIMGLPFERTVKNIDRLHEMKCAGKINFNVRLTHVTNSRQKSVEINNWLVERWPEFNPCSYRAMDWLGLMPDETRGQEPSDVPALPCLDWHQVHILADGSEALCCFDALGKFASGNVNDQHILEMYNVDWQRKARRLLVSRRSDIVPKICHGCPSPFV